MTGRTGYKLRTTENTCKITFGESGKQWRIIVFSTGQNYSNISSTDCFLGHIRCESIILYRGPMGWNKIESCKVSASQTLRSNQITRDPAKMQILTQQVWGGVFGKADNADIADLWTTREYQAFTECGCDVFCLVQRVQSLCIKCVIITDLPTWTPFALYSVQHWFGKNGKLQWRIIYYTHYIHSLKKSLITICSRQCMDL